MTFVSSANAETEKKITFELSELSILSGRKGHNFTVELAVTMPQRARGLMYRKYMPPRNGMLFLFEEKQMVTMWMENTYISLDIIFIDQKGTIVHIAKSAAPMSRDYIHSTVPVISVLELNGGATDRLKIQAGDRIIHPFFNQ
ncbi:hypothetical protein MNBD_ALPHA01-818 [hydrothermal vent metagenome]|uniref:DUF192 domain-containing protein n=1 Tax=hydrothermal vent metagenome TaxID=652676 RepID=A0A3B0RQA9_9ZZZZ